MLASDTVETTGKGSSMEYGNPRHEQHEEAVRSLHDRSVKAVLGHDRKAVEEVFHPDFRSAGGDFQFDSREDIARGIEDGTYKYRHIENRNQKVEFPAPNIAVVTGERTVEGTIKGDEFSSTFHNTAVYTRDDNEWKVLLWAVTC
jgi:uncharacterized protein (TIGR02246 family)